MKLASSSSSSIAPTSLYSNSLPSGHLVILRSGRTMRTDTSHHVEEGRKNCDDERSHLLAILERVEQILASDELCDFDCWMNEDRLLTSEE